MGKNSNVIEINGKRYDARTGALLPSQSVDGLSKPVKHAALAPVAAVKPVAITKKPVMNDIVRTAAPHANGRKPQTAQTLMRHVVKKPSPSLKRTTKVQIPADVATRASGARIIAKPAAHKLNPKHVSSAQKVSKSNHISRFSKQINSPSPSLVAATPQHNTIRHAAPSTPTKPKTTAELLQQALDHATSHEQTYTDPKRSNKPRPVVSISMGVLALFVIVGVIASQSYTTLKLQVASSKAGFNASLPQYKPAGYSLGNLTYEPGNVGIHFKSNSDERSFSITEKASQWDSGTLRDQVIEPSGAQYQAIESAGRTIFVDDKQTANWVNGGVWYQVSGNDSLSEKQLVEIAKSL